MPRIREYIDVCRMIVAAASRSSTTARRSRSPLARGRGHRAGQAAEADQPPGARAHPDLLGQPDGPVSVEATAQHADGWLPIFFDPEKFQHVWGDELEGRATPSATRRSARCRSPPAAWSPSATSSTATAPDAVLDFARPSVALYVGGMGARDKNFYNTICQQYGYEDEAIEIQDLYLDGKKDEAAAAVPGRAAREDEPRRAGRLHQGAPRRLQGGRRHAPVGQPRRRRPGQDDREAAATCSRPCRGATRG